MDPITAKLMSAAGAAAEPVYVDDVFSTFLFVGNASTQTITNGIDLSGEGGLVWTKNRTSRFNNFLYDTERGVQKYLISDSTIDEQDVSTSLTAFNSDGFTLGANDYGNITNGNEAVSWTFRKCPGFFDIVTYTGTGSTRTVAHNLGSVPGMIIFKRTDASVNWFVYHRSLGATKTLRLDTNEAFFTQSTPFNNTEPTSTHFTVGSAGATNVLNGNYIAYVFAHDDQSFGDNVDEAIINCGSYTGTGTADFSEKTLGFEPQWVMVKRTDSSGPWLIGDSMRGIFSVAADDNLLQANANGNEADFKFNAMSLTPRGFTTVNNVGSVNGQGGNYIYIAIRRPHKPPEAATDVYAIDTQNSGSYSSPPYYRSDFVVDAGWRTYMPDGNGKFGARMLGGKNLQTHSSDEPSTDTFMFDWDYNNGFGGSTVSGSGTDVITHMFKRAPGFFDVVTYSGTGSSGLTVNHNLGTTPELLIYKNRTSNNTNWFVITASQSANLNNDNAFGSQSFISFGSSSYTINTTGTSTNNSGQDYLAFLFATLSGISKVGSYTGTGSDLDVDCGFTAGARFVLIKRTDSSADWFLFDTKQGIVSGNDPYWRPNTSSPQVTGNDYIDPLNSGFTVTSSAPAALNTSGGTYIFLAIA